MAKRRKTCNEKGCRKGALDGSQFCGLHQEKTVDEDPMEAAKKLTEVERLRFFEVDISLRNHAQEIQILTQEQRLDQHEFDARKTTRQQRIYALRITVQQKSADQRRMLEIYGKKYGFDPIRTSIDDQTGVIHEHGN